MKILVIEDQPTQCKLALHVLTAAGHNVSEAMTAEQALVCIKMNRPDLILLDLFLPDIDGLTLVRRLKADPDTAGIHVVAVTSYPEEFSKAEALAAGCDAYFAKPINTRELPLQLSALAEGDIVSKAKAP